LPHQKIWFLGTRRSRTETLISKPGPPLMGKLTSRLIIYSQIEKAFEYDRYTKFHRSYDTDHYLLVAKVRENCQ